MEGGKGRRLLATTSSYDGRLARKGRMTSSSLLAILELQLAMDFSRCNATWEKQPTERTSEWEILFPSQHQLWRSSMLFGV